MTPYVSPDYPTPGSGNFLQYTYQGYQQAMPQSTYYGGPGTWGAYPQYASPYVPGYDTESRRNPMQYQQPVPQPQTFVQQVAPFSTYGGSGMQPQSQALPQLPTLDQAQMPSFQAPYGQQSFPTAPVQPSLPAWAQGTNMGGVIGDDRFVPVFSGQQIPMIDKKQQNWENVYVQPQQLPMPSINWQQPATQQQPQFVPPQCQCPFMSQNAPVTRSWFEIVQQNFGKQF